MAYPLRSMFVGLAAMGAAVGPMTGNANGQEAVQIVNASNTASQRSVSGQAVDFGRADSNNIAIMMYYGLGNRTAPDVAAQMVVDELENAGARANFDPNVRYFYEYVDNFEGIIVDYTMGGTSIEGVDIREAVRKPNKDVPVVVADRVIDKRVAVNNVLNLASNEY